MKILKTLLATLFLASSVQGAMFINVIESYTSVVFSYSGSLNTSGLVSTTDPSTAVGIRPSSGIFLNVPVTSTAYNAFTTPVRFGDSTATVVPDLFTGDTFGLSGNTLRMPQGYVSGIWITGSMTFNNADFASLGLDPSGGPYVWTRIGFPEDTITMTFSPAPEPSAYAAILGLAGLATASLRRRRR